LSTLSVSEGLYPLTKKQPAVGRINDYSDHTANIAADGLIKLRLISQNCDLYGHLHVPFGLKASRRGNPAREDISMKKMKSLQRSPLKNVQNNEGVRVTKDSKENPKGGAPTKPEKKGFILESIKGAAVQISVKWCYENWSLIHEKASVYIDVVMEFLK